MYKVSGYSALDKSPRRLWRSWVMLNVCGALVGFVVSGLIVQPLTARMGETLQRYFVVGAAFLLLGLHQVYLTRYLRLDHGAWSWNTGWGSCVGLLLVYPLASLVRRVTGGVAVGANEGLSFGLTCIGLGVGAAQWLVLRRALAGAGLWVLASVVGAGGGSAAGFLGGGLLPPGFNIVAGAVLGVLVYAIVTGVFLLVCLPAHPVLPADLEEEEDEELLDDDALYRPTAEHDEEEDEELLDDHAPYRPKPRQELGELSPGHDEA